MSPTTTPSVAPPGWYWQASMGRYLWWDGYRWIDAAAPQYDPTGTAGWNSSSEANTWWPKITSIKFPAAIVGIAFMAVLFFAQLWVVDQPSGDGVASVVGLVCLVMSIIGMPLVAIAAAHRWGSDSAARSIGLRMRWIDLAYGFGGFLAMYGVVIACNIIWVAFGAQTGSNLEGIQENGRVDMAQFWFLFALAGLIAPLTEELLFRGTIFRGLLDKMGTWPALVLQAIFFGSMHYTPDQGWGNLNLIVSLGLAGLVLGIFARGTDRLAAPMIAHAMFNMINVLLLLTL